MSLKTLRDALLAVSDKVYRYHAPANTEPPYFVWAEDGGNDFTADGIHAERAYQGTVDLYTLEEDDPRAELIAQALDTAAQAWYLNSVQYEDETGLIHTEWVFEVTGNG